MKNPTEKASVSAIGASAVPTVGGVMATNQADENSKKSEQKHTLNLLIVIAVLSLVIAFQLWLQFMHFPLANHLPTQNAATLCQVPPIEQPRLTNPQVIDFAKDMAVSIYSTDYLNYRTTITNAADKYMLPSFRDQWIKVMSSSDFLKTVTEGRYVVTAITTANRPPQVVRAGMLNGAYAWKIQIPLTMYYQSGRSQQDDRVVAEVTVTQVDPTKINMNSRGIAVSWLELKPAAN